MQRCSVNIQTQEQSRVHQSHLESSQQSFSGSDRRAVSDSGCGVLQARACYLQNTWMCARSERLLPVAVQPNCSFCFFIFLPPLPPKYSNSQPDALEHGRATGLCPEHININRGSCWSLAPPVATPCRLRTHGLQALTGPGESLSSV